MLAVLDPLLFDGVQPVSKAELDEVVRILQSTRAKIPDSSYWRRLQLEIVQPLVRKSSREIRVRLDAIRGYLSSVRFPELPPRVNVWDFRLLFEQAGPDWTDVMATIVTGCALIEETLLVTRLIAGRNVRDHSGPGDCSLVEKTCWNLRVQVPGTEVRRIPAVCNRRNVSSPWTTRFDDRLPSADDIATFPFCPPQDWFKSSVRAFETHQGRPAWADAKGNHWSCPATGWGYHWDVYLQPDLADEYGLDQLNVIRWGAPPEEGAVGALHHVPRRKAHRLKKTTGWSC